ncbi:ABC transporter permease [Phaeovulum veldkampii]|uniref:ABC transporter permease n=1 Tax=Phaeovulum veldkampii TaxID=33049 RepID=UPI0010D87E94|nr:FtsX-like permease family protein [Phaeovulum veldkampii]TDQ59256.1 putative ABC transport system permease protein [Phaeovulum veldkampii DSM 11550]
MTGDLALAARIARRELRGGLAGFRVFLLCLILGVAAIAAVGTVRAAIGTGLADQGRVLLGGDAQLSFTYRYATPEERGWMAAQAEAVSEVIDFRSMVVRGAGDAAERALTRVKAVDGLYPLVGDLVLDPPIPLDQALGQAGGLPGAVMDGVLVDRLGMQPGDTFRVGLAEFRLTARLLREPDSATSSLGIAPRTLVRSAALTGAGLLEPGSIFDTDYRLRLAPGTDLAALEAKAEADFDGAGMRWTDARRATPGAERFVDRIADFLVLVGLAGLAVGGIGISAAVRAWMERKTETIATLKALGATAGLVRAVFLIQLAVLTALGVGLGLLLGAGLPLLAAPAIAARMPIAVDVALAPAALAEAAVYGVLVAGLFTLWPLSRMAGVRAAALFRDIGPGRRGWPDRGTALALAGLAVALGLAAVGFSGAPMLALGALGGIVVALAVLALVAAGVRRAARALAAQDRLLRGRPGLRAALAAIGGPRSETGSVILSLGLGLSVLAAVGQVDAGLRSAVSRDLPARAPAYFVLDIQPDQLDPVRALLAAIPMVEKVETAPMLRGTITRINGRPAREVAGEHWVVRGDRGVTYAATPPEGTRIVAGEWWAPDHTGPAEASFSANEAREIGVGLGDRLTVNVLGRDVEATITSLREVDFSTGGIGFVLTLNAAALAGAPHTNIATIYAPPEAEAAVLRDLAGAFPNITAIRVREVIEGVSQALTTVARASALAAGVTLLTGFVVLIGAAAAGERARAWEAAIFKVLGATRGTILASFALRAGLMGLAAGLVAIAFGAAAGWAVVSLVMEAEYRFAPLPALAVVLGGAGASLLAGLAFALRPLAARPAQVLRARD